MAPITFVILFFTVAAGVVGYLEAKDYEFESFEPLKVILLTLLFALCEAFACLFLKSLGFPSDQMGGLPGFSFYSIAVIATLWFGFWLIMPNKPNRFP